MKKILFLHGFFASGQCVPAVALKEAFEGEADVITPDLPIHPKEALRFIRELIDREKPDLLIGNSCGSFYAQMVAPVVGVPALLGNPHFRMTEFLKQRIGEHQYKSPRKDGKQNFVIDEVLIEEFAEMEAIQFSNCNRWSSESPQACSDGRVVTEEDRANPDFKDRIWGLFGEKDTLAHFEPTFLKYYSKSFHFPGGHTPTADEVRDWYVPIAERMLKENLSPPFGPKAPPSAPEGATIVLRGESRGESIVAPSGAEGGAFGAEGGAIKLIIFDFDGTLGDTRRNIVTTMQMTIAELGLSGRTDDECASKIGLPLDGCFEALYPDADKKTVQRCANTYRRIFQENLLTMKPQLFPKVKETLSILNEQGYTLTIASSRWHKSLSELTHDLDIAKYIAYLVGADDVVNAKPNSEPVLKTLAATGFDASQTLVVGDMNVDILMGLNAGAKTCGVTYGNGTKKELEDAGANYIIDSIDELTEIVSR